MTKQHYTILCMVLAVSCSALILSGCKKSSRDVYQKAMAAYRSENYQQAAELFEIILSKYPEHNLTWNAHYQLGELYFYKLRQPETALKHLQDLAQSQHGKYSLQALDLMGIIYESMNNCLLSVEVYRTLIEQYTSEVEVGQYLAKIGECYFKRGDYAQAVVEYETLIAEYPESPQAPRAKFQIANSYALQEDWETAITLYEGLLLQTDQFPEQLIVDIKTELAFCYENQERLEEALALYKELMKVNPKVVLIDQDLLLRRIERVKLQIEDANREPAEVDWQRKNG